jgi:ankyrin repeat protein
VKYLLQKGADPNIRDSRNFTSLQYAKKVDSVEIINALVRSEATQWIRIYFGAGHGLAAFNFYFVFFSGFFGFH